MLRRLFAKWLDRWPEDVPKLYPDLDFRQLSEFLTDDDFEHAASFETFFVTPFIEGLDTGEQTCFGVGLSALMIRNLMLLRDVSIRSPEDTTEITVETVRRLWETRRDSEQRNSGFVTGVATLDDRGFKLNAEVLPLARPESRVEIVEADFAAFLMRCSTVLAEALGCEVGPEVTRLWSNGQPTSPESLVRYGRLRLSFAPGQERSRSNAAVEALKWDRTCSLAAWEIDQTHPQARECFLNAFERDPYNAQLAVQLYWLLTSARRDESHAFQYCRRAIELSPGHGKAHMCAPHNAHPEVDMGKHAELGYRLLPSDPFAVDNYIQSLRAAGAPKERLVALAEESIAVESHDPSNYHRLIEIHAEDEDFESALAVAERLQKLYEPMMDDRALDCLRQSREIARQIDVGEYDPVEAHRKVIEELRRRVEQQAAVVS